jgi:mRNA interferase MazF
VKRGEIYWANLDPTIGSEISKKRPVLIVSNDINNQYSSCVTVLPITKTTGKIYPFEVFISTSDSLLQYDSKVKANQIRTIDKQRMLNKISELSADIISQVNNAIRIHLGL